MSVRWSQLVFTPDEKAIDQLTESWGWLIAEHYMPLLFSILGDLFYQPASGGVYWINCGLGEKTQIAASPEEFNELLGTEKAVDWFLPQLVEQLYASGKIPKPGECYSFAIMPIFREGNYEVDNLHPVPAARSWALSGAIHRQISGVA